MIGKGGRLKKYRGKEGTPMDQLELSMVATLLRTPCAKIPSLREQAIHFSRAIICFWCLNNFSDNGHSQQTVEAVLNGEDTIPFFLVFFLLSWWGKGEIVFFIFNAKCSHLARTQCTDRQTTTVTRRQPVSCGLHYRGRVP